jgi:hypothetical protein
VAGGVLLSRDRELPNLTVAFLVFHATMLEIPSSPAKLLLIQYFRQNQIYVDNHTQTISKIIKLKIDRSVFVQSCSNSQIERQETMMGHRVISQTRSIASLNNEGAARIDAGDLEGGTGYLKNALKASKKLIREQQGQADSLAPPPPPCYFSLDHQLITFTANNAARNLKSSVCNDCESSDEGPFVVRQPMLIRQSSSLEETGSSRVLAIVVVFNLAIATHMTAMQGAVMRNDLLRKAIQLYECALNLIKIPNGFAVAGSEVVLLAILNNLAYSHASLGDNREAENWSQHLLSSLMFAVDHRMGTDTTPTATELLECFLRSTHHYILARKTAAAA